MATSALVIVGIVAAVITNRTLELSERAWIAAVGGQVVKSPKKTKGIHINLTFQNTGREPVADVNIRIQNSIIEAYELEFTSMTDIKTPENTVCSGTTPIKGRAVISPNAVYTYAYDTLRGNRHSFLRTQSSKAHDFWLLMYVSATRLLKSRITPRSAT